MKKEILFLLGIFCICVLLSGAASAATVDKKVTVNKACQSEPVIYNNYVAYTDYRNKIPDIYMYNLANNKEKRITYSTRIQDKPAIYGNYIAWEEKANLRNNQVKSRIYDIYMYNIATGKTTPVATTKGDEYSPTIYGNYITYVAQVGSYRDIYLYKISTKQKVRLTKYGNILDLDGMFGNQIVYHDCNYLYVYDLAKKIRTKLYYGGYSGSMGKVADIYGDKVVWQGNNGIYLYSISSKKTARLFSNTHFNNPAIYGNTIVWSDSTYYGNIYAYDLVAKTLKEVSAGSENQFSPDIYKDRVVWEDGRNSGLHTVNYNGNYDIYYTTLPLLTSVSPTGKVYYNTKLSVSLYMNKEGYIFYTLNGTNPTINSARYKTPISISKNTVLKYFAMDKSGNKSSVCTQNYIIIIDKIAPTVKDIVLFAPDCSSSAPNDNIDPKMDEMKINFNECIKKGVNFGKISVKSLNNKPVSIKNINCSGNSLWIEFNQIGSENYLQYNNEIRITLPAGAVTDMAGNNMATPYTLTFKTRPESKVYITHTYPESNVTNASPDWGIKIEFNSVIERGVNFNNISVKSLSNKPVTIDEIYYNSWMPYLHIDLKRLSNDTYLDYDNEIEVTIPAGAVKDSQGNILNYTYTFRFKTAPS